LARLKDANTSAEKTKDDFGPVKWMAPEAMLGRKYGKKSDVFSFAVVCFKGQ
jgi:hypothetical protein